MSKLSVKALLVLTNSFQIYLFLRGWLDDDDLGVKTLLLLGCLVLILERVWLRVMVMLNGLE